MLSFWNDGENCAEPLKCWRKEANPTCCLSIVVFLQEILPHHQSSSAGELEWAGSRCVVCHFQEYYHTAVWYVISGSITT